MPAKAQFRVCPHCKGTFDRKHEGKCPHCETVLAQSTRQCPSCEHVFSRCKSENNHPSGHRRKLCPNCGLELYYPQSIRMRGQTILMADKEAASLIVEIVEEHISHREQVIFVYDGNERNVEIIHAYALIDRSKTFLKRQNNDLGLSAHTFTVELVQAVLKDRYWRENLVSLRQLRNDISKIAVDLFRQKKLNYTINEAQKQTYVNYQAFSAVWD